MKHVSGEFIREAAAPPGGGRMRRNWGTLNFLWETLS
jgi:hypothetical protein